MNFNLFLMEASKFKPASKVNATGAILYFLSEPLLTGSSTSSTVATLVLDRGIRKEGASTHYTHSASPSYSSQTNSNYSHYPRSHLCRKEVTLAWHQEGGRYRT